MAPSGRPGFIPRSQPPSRSAAGTTPRTLSAGGFVVLGLDLEVAQEGPGERAFQRLVVSLKIAMKQLEQAKSFKKAS